MGDQYFSSVAESAERAREWLLAADWAALAAHYDLRGSGVDEADLLSGDFFVRHEHQRPEMAHPGGFWRWRQPFAPSFEYRGEVPDFSSPDGGDDDQLADRDVVEVQMVIRIDQGGGMVQEGVQLYRLRKSGRGYQLLPSPGAWPDDDASG
ncbi:MAG: hypothetical protein AB7S36_03535 [Planctomycetota bacterium]